MAVSVTVARSTRPREYLTEREIEKLIKGYKDFERDLEKEYQGLYI